MDWFGWVILGEGLALAPVALAPLLGQKALGEEQAPQGQSLKYVAHKLKQIWHQEALTQDRSLCEKH